MPYTGCALTLPLESESEEQTTYSDMILINVESEDQKPAKLFEGQSMIQNAVNQSKLAKCNRVKFVWIMTRWHFFIFLAITSSLYAIFHYGLKTDQKKVLLKALGFCDDWRQMAFFLGIYISFAVKKVQDVISVSLRNYWLAFFLIKVSA